MRLTSPTAKAVPPPQRGGLFWCRTHSRRNGNSPCRFLWDGSVNTQNRPLSSQFNFKAEVLRVLVVRVFHRYFLLGFTQTVPCPAPFLLVRVHANRPLVPLSCIFYSPVPMLWLGFSVKQQSRNYITL